MEAQSRVNAEWDTMADSWDEMAGGYRDWFVEMLWEKKRMASSYVRQDEEKEDDKIVVLDFGCGTGLLTESLRMDVDRVRDVISVDASRKMIDALRGKVARQRWTNVHTFHTALGADYDDEYRKDQSDEEGEEPEQRQRQRLLDEWGGKVDVIAASSVLSFIPSCDLPRTMECLARLLKPGVGILCHSDWPFDDKNNPDGFTSERASRLYRETTTTTTTTTIGLEPISGEIISVAMKGSSHDGDEDQNTMMMDVFVGVAARKKNAEG